MPEDMIFALAGLKKPTFSQLFDRVNKLLLENFP